MELGATVCTPRNPNCNVCPLKEYCHAFQAVKLHATMAARTIMDQNSCPSPLEKEFDHSNRCDVCDIEDEGAIAATVSVMKYPLKVQP